MIPIPSQLIFFEFFFASLIRAHRGGFANMWRTFQVLKREMGQMCGISKNGSWSTVDARNFFFWNVL